MRYPTESQNGEVRHERGETRENFPLEEVYLKDGDLYARVAYREDEIEDCRLYPIGENTFGRKDGTVQITFGDSCLVIDGETTYRKL